MVWSVAAFLKTQSPWWWLIPSSLWPRTY
jgi:hypothetical protein